MNFELTAKLIEDIANIKKKDNKIFLLIEKQLKIFHQNHLHPSLRTHKLSGNLDGIWSISLNRQYRLIYYVQDNTAIFFKVGTHDQVYRK